MDDFAPTIRRLSVGDSGDDSSRITVRGKNLDFLVDTDPIDCEAKDALEWSRARYSSEGWQDLPSSDSKDKTPDTEEKITFIIPKNKKMTHFELEKSLKGSQLSIHTAFGTAHQRIWDQASQRDRLVQLLGTMEEGFSMMKRALSTEHGWTYIKSKDSGEDEVDNKVSCA